MIRLASVHNNLHTHTSHRSKKPTTASTSWKSIVDPNSNLYKYAVHEGFGVYTTRPHVHLDNWTCGWIAHLRNSYRSRVAPDDHMDHNVSGWLWPLTERQRKVS